jgi:hypothetical protein
MSKQDKVIQVEALTYSDSYDSLVDRQFRNKASHRAEDTGPYDIERMVKVFGSRLIRSRQEYATSPSGFTTRLQWASLCFSLGDDTFVTMLAKGNAGMRALTSEDEFKATVTSDSPEKAAQTLARIRNEFLPKPADQGPAFFIMTGGRRAQRAELEAEHLLDDRRLSLHYGDDIAEWVLEFMSGLSEPGISILRGETGTGKTSFIRHVMCKLAATHRFYFVPVDNFNLLSSGSLTEFWKAEQRDHPMAAKVLVLEDAEALLLDREGNARNPVSNLLNLTDGLMTQFIKLHLITTLNCKRDDLDKALLRPGRLRFFRDFPRIPHERALQLAEALGLKLPRGADFTLAEIFASEKFTSNTQGKVKEQGPVGFSPRKADGP